jgi:hypothetical protein
MAILALPPSARFWAPWVALAGLATAALALAVSVALDGWRTWQGLSARQEVLTGLHVPERGMPIAVAPGIAVAPPADAAALLAAVEMLAAGSGSRLLQFVPEAVSAAADRASRPVRLRVQGPTSALEQFLPALAEAPLALEISTLRLASAATPGELLCELGLRLHGGAAARAADSMAATQPLWREPVSEPIAFREGLFDAPSPVVTTSALAAGAAPVEATPPASNERPREPLADVRLVGILREGERIAALLELPGGGTHRLRPGERVAVPPLYLERATPTEVVFVDPRGGRHTIAMRASPERRP